MKRKIYVGVAAAIMLLFVLLPVSAARLCIRVQFSEVTNPTGFLYYATQDNPSICEEQKIVGEYNEAQRELSFWLDGKHAGKISSLRLDLAGEQQLIGIEGISVSSAGVIKKQWNPIKIFGNDGVSQKNDIETLDLLPARKQVYIKTGSQDPYLMFSPWWVETVNDSFSQYRLSRILVCIFMIAMYALYKKQLFSGKGIGDIRVSVGEEVKKEHDDRIFVALLSVILGAVVYKVVMVQAQPILADYHGHLHVYLPLFYTENWWEGWMAVPYCMWHLVTIFFHSVLMLPLNTAGAYTGAVFAMFGYFVLYWMISRITGATGVKCKSGKIAVIAFCLSILQGLSAGWIDTADGYLGIYSMNPLHNPTQMCVKPFVLLCFALVYDIFEKIADAEYKGIFFRVEEGLKKHYIYLAILLFLSTLAKPTFAQMFIPTVGILMLIKWISLLKGKKKEAKSYFAECVKMLLCALPSLLYIVVSYIAFFVMGGSIAQTGGVYLTGLGEVWSMFTENIFLSIALGMAFPLFVLLMDSRAFVKDSFGRLALLGYVVGLLEALFIGESGEKLAHGNFIWPMLSGMTLLWIVATVRLLYLEKEGCGKGKRILIGAAWILFSLHVLCGYYYIQQLLIV